MFWFMENYFSDLANIDTAVISIDNIFIQAEIHSNTFERCKSNDGTCGMKISCLYSEISNNCFSHLTTNYIDSSYDGGTAISVRSGQFDIKSESMIDVVQSSIMSHAAFLASSSECEVSYMNNSFGSMRNIGTYSNSWDIRSSSAINGSYCVFFHLEGGTCIITDTAKSGQCHHFVFSGVSSAGISMLINNFISSFYIDDCICVNSTTKSSSPVNLARWYFDNTQNLGNIFSDIQLSPKFELEILITQRCDLDHQGNIDSCIKKYGSINYILFLNFLIA